MNNDDMKLWLTSRLDRLEEKQDETRSQVYANTLQLARNTDSLEVHIEGVKAVNKRVDQVQAQINPIVAAVTSVAKFGSWVFKGFIALGAVSGAVAGLLKLFG